MRHPKLYEFAGAAGAGVLGGDEGWVDRLPIEAGPLKAWLSERQLPAPAPKSFRRLWRERRRSSGA